MRARAGVQTRQIRDRKASDSTRIPRKTAVNGAQTCVSSQIDKRKNPHDYAERRTIGPAGPDGGEGGIRTHGEFHPTSDFELIEMSATN